MSVQKSKVPTIGAVREAIWNGLEVKLNENTDGGKTSSIKSINFEYNGDHGEGIKGVLTDGSKINDLTNKYTTNKAQYEADIASLEGEVKNINVETYTIDDSGTKHAITTTYKYQQHMLPTIGSLIPTLSKISVVDEIQLIFDQQNGIDRVTTTDTTITIGKQYITNRYMYGDTIISLTYEIVDTASRRFKRIIHAQDEEIYVEKLYITYNGGQTTELYTLN